MVKFPQRHWMPPISEENPLSSAIFPAIIAWALGAIRRPVFSILLKICAFFCHVFPDVFFNNSAVGYSYRLEILAQHLPDSDNKRSKASAIYVIMEIRNDSEKHFISTTIKIVKNIDSIDFFRPHDAIIRSNSIPIESLSSPTVPSHREKTKI